jgi:hypothetical protein
LCTPAPLQQRYQPGQKHCQPQHFKRAQHAVVQVAQYDAEIFWRSKKLKADLMVLNTNLTAASCSLIFSSLRVAGGWQHHRGWQSRCGFRSRLLV